MAGQTILPGNYSLTRGFADLNCGSLTTNGMKLHFKALKHEEVILFLFSEEVVRRTALMGARLQRYTGKQYTSPCSPLFKLPGRSRTVHSQTLTVSAASDRH
jgi:hypothetical protein